MGYSIEPRSPFLDKELWEFVYGLDDIYRINKAETKYILKKVASKYLSKDFVYRKKEGFVFPLYPYLLKSREIITERLIRLNTDYQYLSNLGLTLNKIEEMYSEIRKTKSKAYKTSQIIHCLNTIALWAENPK